MTFKELLKNVDINLHYMLEPSISQFFNSFLTYYRKFQTSAAGERIMSPMNPSSSFNNDQITWYLFG